MSSGLARWDTYLLRVTTLFYHHICSTTPTSQSLPATLAQPDPTTTPPLPSCSVHKITEEIEKYENGLKDEEEEDPEVASRHRAQTTAFEQKAEEELTEMEDID